MKYLFFIPLAAFIINLFALSYIAALDWKNKVNRSFILFAASLAAWVLSSILYYKPPDESLIMPSLRFIIASWSLTGFLFLNFACVYAEKRRNLFYYIILGLTIAGIFIIVTTDWMVSSYRLHPWGFNALWGNLYAPIIILIFTIPVLYSLHIIIMKRRQTPDALSRKQQLMIIWAIVVNLVVGFALEYLPKIFPSLLILNHMAPASSCIWSMIIFYAIAKYRFLKPDIFTAAERLFADLQDGVIIINPGGEILELNEAAREIIGYTDSTKGRQFIHPYIKNYRNDESYKDYETTTGPEDSPRIIVLTQSDLFHRNLTIGKTLIIKDITERKAMFRNLSASEEQFRSMVENITDVIYSLTGEGIITYISPVIRHMTGYNSAEIIGKLFTDFIHPEDVPVLMEKFSKFEEYDQAPQEFRLRKKDGSFLQVISSNKIIKIDNEIMGLRGVLTNVDPLRKARDELEKTQRIYSLVVNNITDMVWIFDIARFKITYVSPSVEKIFGWTPEEYLDIEIQDRMDPRSLQDAVELLTDEIENDADREPDRIRKIDFIEIDKYGNRLSTEATIRFLRDKTGKAVELIGVSRDITIRKMLEDELKKSLTILRERNETMVNDLNTARLIQQALLPEEVPVHPRLKISFRYLPLATIGGDYFNFIHLQEGGLGVFLGDVTGHGVPAALFLSLLKSVTNKIWRQFATIPSFFIDQLNSDLQESMPSYYITAIYGLFQEAAKNGTMRFTFANGGHPGPIILRKADETTGIIDGRGPLLGAFDKVQYENQTVLLERGDRIFLYTDGLPETMNEKNEILGFDELPGWIRQISRPDLDETLDSIIYNINIYRGSNPLSDDIVIIGFEIL
ncbi:MAG: hypothetical protein CVV44_06745 [Spirochaetae bacterium HGW-Spirochaetae-1]|jgi:PAS domain S-box-containing protein|nr:MAG: hypothetical protein CVV44_06745 [Spirochaetae bacterium HGW-Spirochaetae-1]